MPQISIVIPAYNVATFIHVALDSIVNQSYQDFEIVIVNDGSRDNTQEVLEAYAAKHADKDIRIIEQDNQGYSGARNTGIEAARGKYICLLDADDEYYPESLALRVRAFEKYDVDFVIGWCHKVFKIGESRECRRDVRKTYPDIVLEEDGDLVLCDCREVRNIIAMRGFPMHSNTITYKAELLRELGGYNQDFALNEDWELVYKTFFKVDRAVFVNRYLADYKYYMQYVNHTDHVRTDIKIFYETERRRFVRMIKLLNEEGFDKKVIRCSKARACSRKYKYKGLVAYRSGENLKALKYYAKARRFDPDDRETGRLMLKALAPRFLQSIGKRIMDAKRRYEFKT